MINIFQYLILIYLALLNSIYFILSLSAIKTIFFKKAEYEAGHLEMLSKAEGLAKISFVIPVFNESQNIIFCAETILNLSYSHKQVIIVNDGSADDTLDVLKSHFKLSPIEIPLENPISTGRIRGYYQSQDIKNLLVVDKIHSNKPDTLNAGINVAQSDYLIFVDSDTLIDNTELNRMLRSILSDNNIIVGGSSIKIANNSTLQMRGIRTIRFPKKWIVGIQELEYLRSFLMGRGGWDLISGSFLVSGALLFFKTDYLKNLGGFDPTIVTEDLELITRFKISQIEKGKSPAIHYFPHPIAWTEAPETLTMLGKQRTRWHLGLMKTLWKHKKIFFNPKYGSTGTILFPFFVFGEMLLPLIELCGYILIFVNLTLGVSTLPFTLAFLAVSWGYTVLMSLFVILLEQIAFPKYTTFKDTSKLIFCCFLENFGYRQMTIWWRLRAFVRFFKQKINWDEIKKIGFTNYNRIIYKSKKNP